MDDVLASASHCDNQQIQRWAQGREVPTERSDGEQEPKKDKRRARSNASGWRNAEPHQQHGQDCHRSEMCFLSTLPE